MTRGKKTHDWGTEIRRLVIEMSYRSKTSHIGSATSISDILAALYFGILQIDPKRPDDPNRDRFILSKGHGAAALYATLALRGYFPVSELEKYRVNKGRFHGHPCRESAPGIEVSTGSLGHGLSIGAGMALTLRKQAPKSRVHVLMGDGECNEGSVWESAMFAITHQLSNLIVIIDVNGFQGFGESTKVHTYDLSHMWAGFGWKVLRTDGHSATALNKALEQAKRATTPTVILAKTIAGKGVPILEDQLKAHYHVLKEEEYADVTKMYA